MVLAGHAENDPFNRLVLGAGANWREAVLMRAYASYLFGSTPKETGELARQAVDLGLTAMKFGWGPFGRGAPGPRPSRSSRGNAVANTSPMGWW